MELQEVIASIVTGALGWIAKSIKERLDKKKEKRIKESLIGNMRAISQVNKDMYDIEKIEGVGRCFLFEISNGGDRPMPGARLYARAVEVFSERKDRGDLLKRYDKVRLDDSFIKIIIASERNGLYEFETETEQECILKDFHISESIKFSLVYHIHTDSNRKIMFILIVSTYNDDEHLNKGHKRQSINALVSAIRNQFEIHRQ